MHDGQSFQPDEQDETVRLEALHSLGILDTDRDPLYDDITALAAQLCDAPVALVSLVDRDRQWFKSAHGTALCETDLSRSVCVHAIKSTEPLIIEDTQRDARTVENPLNEEADMRFYAGFPLVGRHGAAFGSLCVLDTIQRTLRPDQIDAMKRLARQVVQLLETNLTLIERQAALETAQVLREEIDHRVANSLQQVAVLLRLQARTIGSDRGQEAIDMARGRVEAIASFHRTLSQVSDGQSIDVSVLFDTLAADLRRNLTANISLVVDVDHFSIGARFAVPLAMVLNEFVANSAKYAFPDGQTGTVSVRARRDGGTLSVDFRDNGVGWGDNAPETRGTGIGMKVIEASAQSLSATYEVDGADGCHIAFSIPTGSVSPGTGQAGSRMAR